MIRVLRDLAVRTLAAASRLLPAHLAPWSQAMQRELAEIPTDGAALSFATGCLRTVLGLALAEWLQTASARVRTTINPKGDFDMQRFHVSPRVAGLGCAIVAVGLGVLYLAAAGAPAQYLFVNLAALVLGVTAWLALRPVRRARLAGSEMAILICALLLMLTALVGVAVEGAARWVDVGPINLQVSLILLPAMLALYARHPDAVGSIGMAVAAWALALQPDRAMAGVLLAGLIVLAVATPRLPQLIAAAAAALAFGWTLLVPDTLRAVPFVDGVFAAAFDLGLPTGLAVAAGAALLLLPAVIALGGKAGDPVTLLVFGACWLSVVVAAALGNYPTPLVGYGGSAVLGYLLSVALLPTGVRGASHSGAASAPASDRDRDNMRTEWRGAQFV